MIQADFVVCACVLSRRRADEAVMDEQLVIRVGAICGQNFFANLCSVSVLVSQAGLCFAHLCCCSWVQAD